MVLNLLNHATKIGWEAPEMRTGYERIQSVKPEAELPAGHRGESTISTVMS